MQIILAFGAISLYNAVKQRYGTKIVKKLMIGCAAVILGFFVIFLEDWFVQSPKKVAKSMLYGHFEAAQWVAENIPADRQIIVSRKLSEPHIFVAYANNWDPIDYQEATNNWPYKENDLLWVDQLPEYSLGNYTFRNFYWEEDREEDAIFVGKPEDFPENIGALKTINYPDNSASVLIVDSKFQIYANASNK